MASSPILHSTHHASPALRGQNQQGQGQVQPVLTMLGNGNRSNSMNLSGGSGSHKEQEQAAPGTSSKIFEHKASLRNVSPEMEQKLTELKGLGFKNRTFNLVMLKQENGDMQKTIENLRKFYQSN